jgi:hypothetical protein
MTQTGYSSSLFIKGVIFGFIIGITITYMAYNSQESNIQSNLDIARTEYTILINDYIIALENLTFLENQLEMSLDVYNITNFELEKLREDNDRKTLLWSKLSNYVKSLGSDICMEIELVEMIAGHLMDDKCEFKLVGASQIEPSEWVEDKWNTFLEYHNAGDYHGARVELSDLMNKNLVNLKKQYDNIIEIIEQFYRIDV